MTNAIGHIGKNTFQMGPNFITPESVKTIVFDGQRKNKFEQKNSMLNLLKTARKNLRPIWAFWFYRG